MPANVLTGLFIREAGTCFGIYILIYPCKLEMHVSKDDIAKASFYSSSHLSVGFLAAGVVRFSSVLSLPALAVSSSFFLPCRESFL
jgi:hypothetical protein